MVKNFASMSVLITSLGWIGSELKGMLNGIVIGMMMAVTAEGSMYDSYFEGAAQMFCLDVSLLKRIAMIESSMNPRAINRNTNGSIDIGMMQINTIHLKRLSKIGVTREALLDPEVNIYVGAMLLSSHIRRRGYNLDAIGRYHSANPLHKAKWLKRLAMATIPDGNVVAGDVRLSETIQDDPRSRFSQVQLSQRTDAKIAMGMKPKAAWREAKAEVDRLMGYRNE